MTIFLSIFASVFNLLSGGSYLVQVIKGRSIPNPATWLIWVIVTIINTLTYFLVTGGNLWISLSSIVLACGIVFIFIFSLIKGKFSKLGKIEVISLVIAFGVVGYWVSENAPVTESNPTTGKVSLDDNGVAALIKVSWKLLRTSAQNVTKFVATLAAKGGVLT
jgi:hypothetical protein